VDLIPLLLHVLQEDLIPAVRQDPEVPEAGLVAEAEALQEEVIQEADNPNQNLCSENSFFYPLFYIFQPII